MTPSSPAAATNQASTSGLRGRVDARGRPPSAPATPARIAGRYTALWPVAAGGSRGGYPPRGRVGASSAGGAGIGRTINSETPVCRYIHPPTPSASSRPAVRRSARLAWATKPSSPAAAPHTRRNTTSGTAERRESSSSGSASGTGGPGTAEGGWITYSQPIAATTTANDVVEAGSARAALAMREPLRCRQVGPPGHAAPQRPVVAACELEVAVRDVRLRQGAGELLVLLPERIVGPGVDPEVGVQAAQSASFRPEAVERRVQLEARER